MIRHWRTGYLKNLTTVPNIVGGLKPDKGVLLFSHSEKGMNQCKSVIQKIADDFFKPDFEYKYLKFHEIDTWPTFTENKIDSCYDRKGEILIPS